MYEVEIENDIDIESVIVIGLHFSSQTALAIGRIAEGCLMALHCKHKAERGEMFGYIHGKLCYLQSHCAAVSCGCTSLKFKP